MGTLTLTYSLADQNFIQTKSVGIFNVSMQLLINLIGRIPPGQLTVFTNSTLEDKLQLPPGVTIQRHNEAISSRFGRILWDQWGVYEAAKKSKNEWLFLPKGFVSFVKRPTFKLAVYSYDSVHEFYRVSYPGVISWLESRYFSRSLKSAFKFSDLIFTDSDFAKGELEHLASSYKLNHPPIITAGIGFSRANNMVPIKRDSILFLTSVWPHKLTQRGIDFIARWQRQNGFKGNVDLVGSLPVGLRLPQIQGWKYHQRLSEEAYRQFLAESRALLFFSAYEGFGMPPVEAMIAGTCPVFSDLPVTREVMGDRGYSFSNDSFDSFEQALNKALGVSDTQIQLWAEQLLRCHNWDKVVEKVINGMMQVTK
jgi:glycosyltransferase involved in cell wall biosynthesis